MKRTLVAGGVVINAKGQVLVVSQHGDSWSLPKGHVDPGEDELSAARREIFEESGLEELLLEKPLGRYERSRIGKGGVGEDKGETKTIVMFLFRSTQDELKPRDPDNPEARWVRPDAVAGLLTHPKDKEFFLKVLPAIAR